MSEEQKKKFSRYAVVCHGCQEEMIWVGAIEPSDEEGRGGTALYQCFRCKAVTIQ